MLNLLNSKVELSKYLEYLSETINDSIILMGASDEVSTNWENIIVPPVFLEVFSKKPSFRSGFAALVSREKKICDTSTAVTLEDCYESIHFSIYSQGYIDPEKNGICVFEVDSEVYINDKRGLYILVYSLKDHAIQDFVRADLYSSENPILENISVKNTPAPVDTYYNLSRMFNLGRHVCKSEVLSHKYNRSALKLCAIDLDSEYDPDYPYVSILVPVYNVEKYLDQCLNSLVTQTLKNIEIIILNDGSTDSSLNIIHKYCSMDPRFILVDKPNSGYGNTMNIGLDKSKGRYIGIVESDDFVEPNMFEELFVNAIIKDLDISRCNFYFYNHLKKNDSKYESAVRYNCVYSPRDDISVFYQQPSIWAAIYKRNFIHSNNICFLNTPGASYQDTSFTFKTYLSANRFSIIPDALIHYRVNTTTSSSSVSKGKVFCIKDEYDEIRKYLVDTRLFDRYKQLYAHLKYRGYLWNYERLDYPYNEEFNAFWIVDLNQDFRDHLISMRLFDIDDFEYCKQKVCQKR